MRFVFAFLILAASSAVAQFNATLVNGRQVACRTNPVLAANGKISSCVLANDERFSILLGAKMIADIPCAQGASARFDNLGNLSFCTLSTDRSFANYYTQGQNVQIDFRCQAGGQIQFDGGGNVTRCTLANTRTFGNRMAGGVVQVVNCQAGAVLSFGNTGNVTCVGGGGPVSQNTGAGAGGGGGNLALGSRGAVATQSSVYHGSCPPGAQNAIDGVTNAGIANNCNTPIAHTNIEKQPWWQVDLGGAYPLSRIVIWNRNDVAKERLSNFRVTVKDAQGTTVFTKDFFTTGGFPDPSLTIPLPGVAGRVVRIQLLGTNYLNLAEVQVFGAGPS